MAKRGDLFRFGDRVKFFAELVASGYQAPVEVRENFPGGAAGAEENVAWTTFVTTGLKFTFGGL